MWWYNIVYFGWETYGLVQLRCRDQDCQIQSWPPMHTKKNTSGNKKKKTPSRSTLTSLCQTFRNYSDLLSQCTNDMRFWVCFFFEKNRDSELYELDSKLCELWTGNCILDHLPASSAFRFLFGSAFTMCDLRSGIAANQRPSMKLAPSIRNCGTQTLAAQMILNDLTWSNIILSRLNWWPNVVMHSVRFTALIGPGPTWPPGPSYDGAAGLNPRHLWAICPVTRSTKLASSISPSPTASKNGPPLCSSFHPTLQPPWPWR